jgi:hypothetical protein
MQRKVLALVPVVLLSAILSFSSFAPAVHAQSIRASHVSTAPKVGQLTPDIQIKPAGLLGSPCTGTYFVYRTIDGVDHCWYTQGYVGLGGNIYVLAIGATAPSWVRMYSNGAGSFWNIAPYTTYQFNPVPTITQICLNCGYHS